MALIDVSELMLDPDFVDGFQIIRRTATVDTHGNNIITDAFPISAVGSIQAGNGDTLKRLPDEAQLEDTITIYTTTPVYSDKVSGYADIIVVNSLRYQVVNTSPWNNWGAGYYRADCVMEKPSL